MRDIAHPKKLIYPSHSTIFQAFFIKVAEKVARYICQVAVAVARYIFSTQ